LNPFLLFDDFRNDVPDHYLRGFPWHPHRGIETIIPTCSDQNS
jgi:redox-sensitive bicupin YhaK (pirin superfamily)